MRSSTRASVRHRLTSSSTTSTRPESRGGRSAGSEDRESSRVIEAMLRPAGAPFKFWGSSQRPEPPIGMSMMPTRVAPADRLTLLLISLSSFAFGVLVLTAW